MHHKSTAVTERCYDKRKGEELLEKMVLPVGWEAVLEESARLDDEEARNEAQSSVTNSIDRERQRVLDVMLAMKKRNKRLKKKLELAESLFTPELRQLYRDACQNKGLDEDAA